MYPTQADRAAVFSMRIPLAADMVLVAGATVVGVMQAIWRASLVLSSFQSRLMVMD